MAFTPKKWEDEPHVLEVLEGKKVATSKTPTSAAALTDLEERLSAYSDTVGSGKQPLDSDLTAIAALSTTEFGRSLLALASAEAARTALGLGSAATQGSAAFDAAGAAAAVQAASQPLDSDLTAIAALSTSTYGRSLLTAASGSAARTALELGTAATQASTAFDASGAASAAKGEAEAGAKAEVKTEKERAEGKEPTTGQKNALAGANGTPGTGNEYLTVQSKGSAGEAGKVLKADDTTEKTRAEAAEATKASTTEVTTEESRAKAAEALKLAKASNLTDLANAATALANLGAYSAFAPQISGAMFPVGGIPGEIGSAFVPGEKVPVLARVIAPKAGTLKDLMVWPRTSVGNVAMGIYDTGDAEAGKRTRLFQSGSVAVGTANKWQVVAAEPNIVVKAGQQLDLYVVFDTATVELGRSVFAVNGQSFQLPANYNKVTGGASPKLIGATAAIAAITELPATIAEASIVSQGSVPAIACRVE